MGSEELILGAACSAFSARNKIELCIQKKKKKILQMISVLLKNSKVEAGIVKLRNNVWRSQIIIKMKDCKNANCPGF